jgi:mono/diheme cytochrome c family protein
MRSWAALILGIAFIAIALAGMLVIAFSGGRGISRRQGPVGIGGGSLPTADEFRSNGERIYFTAASESGRPIWFIGGPHWFQMHGESCVTCHGPEGRGGVAVPMTNVRAPDIRYSTLTSEQHEEDEHPPYTDAFIKRAITDGLDPAGKQLHWAMPRWRMADRDLNDLLEYLKTLDGDRRE